ncbi:Gldg family protein [Pelagerythrobacter sp.]|uniref:Gldg family protein n=1 Tax=Pelagerythrobacter sp. TaxID=2800702 RepID=UPI0035AFC3AC
MRPTRGRLGLIVAGIAVVCAAAAWALTGGARDKPSLGLFTTLPIYWAETAALSDMLDRETRTGWARGALEERYELVPLDTLARPDGSARGLARVDALLLAQPRALSPQENVALDDWVRAGGRVLVFADPLLTAESRFPIGDRRRPQDVALLSPILRRWGLEMRFDPDQPGGERIVETDLAPLPVNLAGTLHLVEGAATGCWIAYDRLFAQCAVGNGVATVIADAALFEEPADGGVQARAAALDWLTGTAFASDR